MMYYCYLATPIGDLLLAGDDDALSLIGFPEGSMRREPEADWIYSEKTVSGRERTTCRLFRWQASRFRSKSAAGRY